MKVAPKRPWYKKKRYMVPLGVLGVVTMASAFSGSTPAHTTPSAANTAAVEQTAALPEIPEAVEVTTERPQTTETRREDVGERESIPLSNDNYYTNSDGERVHSPAHAPSVPPGASARCRDGTYSFSRSRRGTCSHHGGVAQWL